MINETSNFMYTVTFDSLEEVKEFIIKLQKDILPNSPLKCNKNEYVLGTLKKYSYFIVINPKEK